MGYAVGSLVAPIVGGGLYDIDGFSFATFTVAGLSFIFSVTFFLVMFLDIGTTRKEKLHDISGRSGRESIRRSARLQSTVSARQASKSVVWSRP